MGDEMPDMDDCPLAPSSTSVSLSVSASLPGARAAHGLGLYVLLRQTFCSRSRSAFPMTETEERLIAPAATIGESSTPRKG